MPSGPVAERNASASRPRSTIPVSSLAVSAPVPESISETCLPGWSSRDGDAAVAATALMSARCRIPRPMSPDGSEYRIREYASACTPSTVLQPGASHTRPELTSFSGNAMPVLPSRQSSTPPSASTMCSTPPNPIST